MEFGGGAWGYKAQSCIIRRGKTILLSQQTPGNCSRVWCGKRTFHECTYIGYIIFYFSVIFFYRLEFFQCALLFLTYLISVPRSMYTSWCHLCVPTYTRITNMILVNHVYILYKHDSVHNSFHVYLYIRKKVSNKYLHIHSVQKYRAYKNKSMLTYSSLFSPRTIIFNRSI